MDSMMSLRLDQEVIEALNLAAARRGMPRSELLRRLLIAFLKREGALIE